MTYDNWKLATPPEYEEQSAADEREQEAANDDITEALEAGTCCGVLMTFDPEARGQTCGGLALKGWNICGTCGAGRLVKGRSVEDKGETDEWRLAKGGRSLACGAIKIRAEKGDSTAIEALMSRIARLPELEAEVARLRAELGAPCQHRKP